MSKVFAQITMSLDGFIAGEHDSAANPLGDRGLELHQWILAPEAQKGMCDGQVLAEMLANTGAILLGRRMADVGLPNWGEDGAFGLPCFVVTHRPTPPVRRGRTSFTYVSDGLDRALTLALAAAAGKDVCVVGGGSIVRQCLSAGLIDELRLSVAPVLLGRGVPLFHQLQTEARFSPVRVLESPLATHLTYQLGY